MTRTTDPEGTWAINSLRAMLRAAWAPERLLRDRRCRTAWVGTGLGLAVMVGCLVAVGLTPIIVAWAATGLLR